MTLRAFAGFALLGSLAATAASPQASPPFIIQRAAAAPLTLAGFRGKIVALAFISTTCPHCQDLTRELVPLAKAYSPRGVQVLECAFNEEAPTGISGFIQQFQPPFPVGYAARDAVYEYLGKSVIDQRPLYVPHLVFLDRKGMIRGDFPGESDFMLHPAENIRTALDKLLTDSDPAAKPKTANTAGVTKPGAGR